MTELLQTIATVWTPESIAFATISGFLFGAFILATIAELPVFVSDASPGLVGLAVAFSVILAGAVFYSGQILVDSAEDVTQRLVSRFALWVIYALAMGLGTWVGLAIAGRRHRDRIRAEAVADVDAASGPG